MSLDPRKKLLLSIIKSLAGLFGVDVKKLEEDWAVVDKMSPEERREYRRKNIADIAKLARELHEIANRRCAECGFRGPEDEHEFTCTNCGWENAKVGL